MERKAGAAMRILIVEGNDETIMARNERRGLPQAWLSYQRAIAQHNESAGFDVAYPLAPGRQTADIDPVHYDGFALTGSGIASTAGDADSLPYLKAVEPLLASGKPVIGSCWGMQAAAAILGGRCAVNPAGTELGLARGIQLTESGRESRYFSATPEIFDAPAWHRDHVEQLPEGAELLAGNAISAVQAYRYQTAGTDFFGMQFHPEIALEEYRRRQTYSDPPLPGTKRVIADFPDNPPEEVADPMKRTAPIGQWLDHVRDRLRAT